MKRRVAITGIGLLSPRGETPATAFDALLAGHSAGADLLAEILSLMKGFGTEYIVDFE